MQFESLKVFCDVARNRSFSQAALLNQVTQSAVSQMVAQLERRMGVQLIDRSTRPLQLTPLGKTYFDGCRVLLEQYDELVSSLRSAQARVEGTVQIAAIYSVGLSDMGQHIEEFKAQAPDADVSIEYLHPTKVYEKVMDGSVDVGLVSFPRKMSKLEIVPWRDEPMVVACSPDHPLAQLSEVCVGDLDGVKFVHFSKELGIRREIDRFFRAKRVSVNAAVEFDNIENIKKAVEIRVGAALIPEPTFREEVESGTLVAIPLIDGAFVRPLGIIYRRQLKLSMAAQGFLQLLRNQKDVTPAAETVPPTENDENDESERNGFNSSHNGTASAPKKRGRQRQTQ